MFHAEQITLDNLIVFPDKNDKITELVDVGDLVKVIDLSSCRMLKILHEMSMFFTQFKSPLIQVALYGSLSWNLVVE